MLFQKKLLSFFFSTELLALPSCTEDNGGCQHFCSPSNDRIVCTCKDGFISEKNGAVCVGECSCR